MSNLKDLISEQESDYNPEIVNDAYYEVLQKLREVAKPLGDNDVYELHERLKRFFNRMI